MNKPHIYKITNNINGKFYYGVHNGSNTEKYMGSGHALKKAQKIYGINNFSKEILLWFDTVEEAFEYEAVIVNKEMINNHQCYNMCLGGKGGASFKGCKHKPETLERMRGQKRSKETCNKISKARKGMKFSEEHCKKISEVKKGIPLREELRLRVSKTCKEKGLRHPTFKELPKETQEKIRKGRSKQVTCPHCGKTGSNNPMKQWHFDNCRNKQNKLQ
jgi:hypothetical protein